MTHQHWTYEVAGWQWPPRVPTPDIALNDAFSHAVCGAVTLLCVETMQRIDVTRREYLDDSWRAQLAQQ